MESKFLGAYYLHTNGELIFKPSIVFETDTEYFDSPFVKKVWFIPKEQTITNNMEWYKDFLKEAISLGAKRKSIVEVCRDNCFKKSFFDQIVEQKL